MVQWQRRAVPMLASVSVLIALVATIGAQRPDTAPDTEPARRAPDTVFLEDLTWAEVRDMVAIGWTTAIIGTAGTEQKGPHMVDGEHRFVMEHAADRIARQIGGTLVAPVVTYVPEGSWDNPGGHMGKPGTITLPEDRFIDLLTNAGRSLKSGGFKTILFLGESGGNRTGMRTAAARLNELWKDGSAKAFWIDDYYTKSHADQNAWITRNMGIPAEEIGGHANLLDTSEMLFVNPRHVRKYKILPGGGYANSGVSGDPTRSSAAIGKVFLQIKIDNAVAQIRGLMDGTLQPAPEQAPGAGRGARAGADPAGRAGAAGAAGAGRAGGRGRARRPASPHDGHGARGRVAQQTARHRLHRRTHVGRDARPHEGRQDRGHHPDRRHREERLPHDSRQAQLHRDPRRQ
jgi:creatinine amidohydrolase/Fe(II)-dependent formamide hydrolase-like protein